MSSLLRILASAGLMSLASTVSAMSFTFSLVDNSVVTPVGAPSFAAGGVSFVATNTSGSRGGYAAPVGGGSPSLLGGSSGFSSLGAPSGGRGVFNGTTGGTGSQALYTNVGGSLVQLGGTGGFTSLGNPDDADGTVAFVGDDGNGEGIFITKATDDASTDVPVAVVDQSTDVPGQTGETFAELGDPSTDGDPLTGEAELAFNGTTGSGSTGIYLGDAAGLDVVADEGAAIPDAGGSTFNGFSDPSLDNGQVAFAGTGSGGESGIYVGDANNGVTTVVDSADSGLSGFGSPVLADGVIAFTADDTNTNGLYVADVANSGVLAKVLAVGDSLVGQTVTSILLGPNGVQGGSLAILVGLSDSGSTIVIATPANGVLGANGPLPAAAPVPTSLALLMLGLGLLGYRRASTA